MCVPRAITGVRGVAGRGGPRRGFGAVARAPLLRGRSPPRHPADRPGSAVSRTPDLRRRGSPRFVDDLPATLGGGGGSGLGGARYLEPRERYTPRCRDIRSIEVGVFRVDITLHFSRFCVGARRGAVLFKNPRFQPYFGFFFGRRFRPGGFSLLGNLGFLVCRPPFGRRDPPAEQLFSDPVFGGEWGGGKPCSENEAPRLALHRGVFFAVFPDRDIPPPQDQQSRDQMSTIRGQPQCDQKEVRRVLPGEPR